MSSIWIVTPTVRGKGIGFEGDRGREDIPVPEFKEMMINTRKKTEMNYNHVVVIDEPDPEILSWLHEQDYHVITNEERVGLVKAFNQGLRYAHGREAEYIGLLEDAVLVEEGWLSKMVSLLEAHPEYGWIGAHQYGSESFSAMCSLMTREAYEATGGLDERYSPAILDDMDLIYELRDEGFDPRGIPQVKVHHPKSRTTVGTYDSPKLAREQERKFKEKWKTDPISWNEVPDA